VTREGEGAAAPLAEFGPGSHVRVVGAGAGAPPAVVRRLEDLGFVAGTEVAVVRRAPLRDPTIYRVRDYDVCLRRAQAAHLLAREIGR
jgi:ferrous iron transport protein A